MKNDVDTIIKDLKRQIAEKDLQIDRMKWKIRNLRHSNRQLNRAHIVKNNLLQKREDAINFYLETHVDDSTPKSGCCGGGCHSGE